MRNKNGYVIHSLHHKKKQQSLLFIVIVLGFLIMAGYYFYQHRYDLSISTAKLYFYDSAKDELVPVNRKITLSGQTEKIVKILLEELSKPPKDGNLQSFIPVHGSVADVSLKEGICSLVLEEDMISKSISSVSQEAAAVYCIVNTLTELDSIQKVQIFVQGKKDPTFKQYISLSEPLIRLSGQLPKGQFVRMYYYYLPANMFLLTKVEIPSSSKVEDTVASIVNQLMIRYKDDEDIASFFPEEVTINSVLIEDGTLYLDLSPEFQRFHYGANEELSLVNSITLSLTELPQIQKVRIQIDGKNIDTIGGHTSSLEPYERWHGLQIETSSILYFVLKKEQNHYLIPTFRTYEPQQQPSPEKILQELLKGPTSHEREVGIVSDIPSGTKLISVTPGEENSLMINLDMEMSEFLNAQQEENFLEQIIMTLSENTSFRSFHLYFQGETLESLPFGTEINNPLSRETL
ncbi:MAG: GerMN domain-containing protein [Caldisericia bacterium]|nr:GerMN domain-containing protein [Caldisericia bacterium]MDD4613999.1 GerMN domain-containing protein [Caldisericia bacterium]